MKTATKILLALLASAAMILFLAPSANAAKPVPASAVTITLDAEGTGLPVAEAAADWSKNTGIRVVAGDCSGDKCVRYALVDHVPCNLSTFHQGCAYRVADGSCQVEIWHTTLGRGYLDDLVTKHEGGHCIWSYLGISQSYHLPDTPHALMSATHSGAPSKKEATLTNTDRNFTKSLL